MDEQGTSSTLVRRCVCEDRCDSVCFCRKRSGLSPSGFFDEFVDRGTESNELDVMIWKEKRQLCEAVENDYRYLRHGTKTNCRLEEYLRWQVV